MGRGNRLMGSCLGLLSLIAVVFVALSSAFQTAMDSPASGMILSVYPGTTSAGLTRALMGAPGTQIFMKDSSVIVTWTIQNKGIAWLIFDTKSWAIIGDQALAMRELGIKGNLTNLKDGKALIEEFGRQGWKVISAQELYKILSTNAQTLTTTLVNNSTSLTTFIFVWGGAITDNELYQSINTDL
jgi:hypothetical protein